MKKDKAKNEQILNLKKIAEQLNKKEVKLKSSLNSMAYQQSHNTSTQ